MQKQKPKIKRFKKVTLAILLAVLVLVPFHSKAVSLSCTQTEYLPGNTTQCSYDTAGLTIDPEKEYAVWWFTDISDNYIQNIDRIEYITESQTWRLVLNGIKGPEVSTVTRVSGEQLSNQGVVTTNLGTESFSVPGSGSNNNLMVFFGELRTIFGTESLIIQNRSSTQVAFTLPAEGEFVSITVSRRNDPVLTTTRDFRAVYVNNGQNVTEDTSGDVIQVTWNFGDGSAIVVEPITEELVVHAFPQFGSYVVRAVASVNGETIEGVVEVVVDQTTLTNEGGNREVGDIVGGGIISAISVVLGAIIAVVRWVVWTLTTLIFLPLLEQTLQLGAGEMASGPIMTGWNFVRDVVNMFFILFLIVIGFGTILRIESYSYRKLLVNLIIMAMLVNFSLVIGRIIIQIADVVQFAFLPASSGADSQTAVRAIFQNLSTVHVLSLFDGFKSFSLDTGTATANLFAILFQFILELSVAVTFGALSIFMMIRTAALWILLILSPVAYAFFVLPATSGLSRMWWSSFIKYALFAPIIAFFIRLTAELYQKGLQLFPTKGAWDTSTGADLISQVQRLSQTQGVTFAQALDLGLIFVAVIAFLWAGLIVARQMGIAGAGAIVNLAQKGVALGAIGGTGLIAGFTGRKLGKAVGVQLSPKRWVEEYKAYRHKQIEKDVKETEQRATDRAMRGGLFTSFGSPGDLYKKALNWHEVKRISKNVLTGKWNANRHWLKESESIAEARSEAGKMVSDTEFAKRMNERKEVSENMKKISRGLSDNKLDLSSQIIKNDVLGALKRARVEVLPFLADTEKKKFNEDLKKLQNGVQTGQRDFALDPDSELGAVISDQLKGKQKQLSQELSDIEKFRSEHEGKTVTDQAKDNAFKAVLEKERKLEETRPPLDYESQLAVNGMVAEERKKLTGIEEATHLQSLLNDAIRQKDRYKAMAIMEKLAEDYNDNEFLNNTWIKDSSGSLRNFSSDSQGMHAFREEVMQKILGMGEESALAFTEKIGYINESRNHYETARLVGSRNGRLYAYSEGEHAATALAEIAKKGPREIMNRLNRLGYGGEIQKADGSREFRPSLLGIAILKGLGPALVQARQFEHMNPNAAGKLSDPTVIQKFEQYGVSPAAINQIREKSGTGGGWDPGKVVDDLQEMIESMRRAA